MKKINIALDGYSSCGKSTLAKALAKALKYVYVDTGAMYRAVTLYCIKNNIINNKEIVVSKVIDALKNINISFTYNSITGKSETFLNGNNVEDEIREMAVSEKVSQISLIKEVREKLVNFQKKLGKKKGVVMDGRDIGTKVFPDAELKIFMTADKKVRAMRRYDELISKGKTVTLDQIMKNLANRDHEDTNRKENPLVKADDAIELDNTNLTQEQQFDIAMQWVKERLA